MTARLTDDERARIVKLRLQGRGVRDVAKLVGRSHCAVEKVLADANVPRFRHRPMSPGMGRRCATITRLARQGLTVPKVAARLRLTPNAVRLTASQYALFEGTGLRRLPEVAAELGISDSALRRAVKDGRVLGSHWFSDHAFTPEQVAHAQEKLARLSTTEAAGWLTAAQAARELGLTVAQFRHYRRAQHPTVVDIRQRRVQGGRNTVRYHTQDTLAAAAQLNRPTWLRPLPGVLTPSELAALAYRTVAAVYSWCQAGMPAVRNEYGSGGRLYIDPEAAATWLEAQTGHRSNLLRRAAANIRRSLTGPQERAA